MLSSSLAAAAAATAAAEAAATNAAAVGRGGRDGGGGGGGICGSRADRRQLTTERCTELPSKEQSSITYLYKSEVGAHLDLTEDQLAEKIRALVRAIAAGTYNHLGKHREREQRKRASDLMPVDT